MKKMITCVVLIASISSQLFAQKKILTPNTDKVFEVPEAFLSNRFTIDLGSGNSMLVELSGVENLDRLMNVDSILTAFFHDLVPFKDSLTDELAAKKIDHFTDKAGRKKIRLTIYHSPSSSFVLRQGEVAALKAEQDTINIAGILNMPARRTIHKPFADFSYYRISFFVNDISDLKKYDGKALNEKIAALKTATEKRWRREGDKWIPVKADPSISAKTANGNIPGRGDYLETVLGINMENYKNYFVPSVTVGLTATFNTGRVKKSITALFESKFIFDKDPITGKMNSYKNHFLTLAYRYNASAVNSEYFQFRPNISLGYLIKRRGDYFDKNTFRLGIGQVGFFNDHIGIEPGLYFHDFFKQATPTIKLSVSF